IHVNPTIFTDTTTIEQITFLFILPAHIIFTQAISLVNMLKLRVAAFTECYYISPLLVDALIFIRVYNKKEDSHKPFP
ncbi:MAG: hypothetical protein WAK17_14435, partial [Candidatus Nitrosopolaris sp.]